MPTQVVVFSAPAGVGGSTDLYVDGHFQAHQMFIVVGATTTEYRCDARVATDTDAPAGALESDSTALYLHTDQAAHDAWHNTTPPWSESSPGLDTIPIRAMCPRTVLAPAAVENITAMRYITIARAGGNLGVSVNVAGRVQLGMLTHYGIGYDWTRFVDTPTNVLNAVEFNALREDLAVGAVRYSVEPTADTMTWDLGDLDVAYMALEIDYTVTKKAAPPLRQSPRDDHYVGRLWPRSSMQGTPRQAGGYH